MSDENLPKAAGAPLEVAELEPELESAQEIHARGQAGAGQVTVTEVQSQVWHGPIPSPQVLEEYGRISKDFPERILGMWEGEAAHQRLQQKRALEAEIEDTRKGRTEATRGQWFGLIAVMAAMVCGTYAALEGQPIFGAILGGGGLAALAGAFLVSRWERRQDLPG